MVATFVVGLSSLFYLYEFFLRVAPSSMLHELMRDLNANATQIGIMSGFFFLAYAPMQIPVGLLCDRFGPKKLLTLAVLCCSLAILAFAHTNSIHIASCTRFLIGLASAFGFVGPLVLATHWFEEKHLATVAGIIQAIGCMGAIFAGGPISQLIINYGWRQTMLGAALFGFILFGLFGLFIQDKSDDVDTHQNSASLWQQLKRLCCNKKTWWLSVIAFTSWAPMSIFAELWGTAFLTRFYHAERLQAAAAASWIWVGVAVGSIVAGWWSTKIGSRKIPLYCFHMIGIFTSILIVMYHFNSWPLLDFFLFLFGLSAGSQPITFGLACEQTPASIHGAAMGFNNMAVIAGGVVLQPLVGLLLTLNWDHQMFDGAPIYQTLQYQHAFLLIPACYLLGLWVTHYKIAETHCQPYSAA